MIFKEAIRGFRKRFMIYLLMLILLASANVMGNLSLHSFRNTDIVLKEMDDLPEYAIIDNFDNKSFKEFYEPVNLQRLRSFVGELRQIPHFTCWETSTNHVELLVRGKNIPEQLLLDFGNGKTVMPVEGEDVVLLKSFQINTSLTERGVKMLKGRDFLPSDFIVESSDKLIHIPVILGYDYSDIFNVGDTIDFYFLNKRMTGVITGVAAQNSVFVRQNSYYYIDDLVIIPSLDFVALPVYQDGAFFQTAVYLNHANTSFIPTDDEANFAQLVESVNMLNEKYGYSMQFLSVAPYTQATLFRLAANRTGTLYIFVTTIFIIFTQMITIFLLIIDYKSNTKNRIILSLCGHDLRGLQYIPVIQYGILLIASHLLAALLTFAAFITYFVIYGYEWIAITISTYLVGILIFRITGKNEEFEEVLRG